MSTLVVRLDSMGDVLVTEPAIRAIAAVDGPVTLLAGPSGAETGRLLPGVARVLTWLSPWIAPPPAPPVQRLAAVRRSIRRLGVRRAVIFTSASQSALPTALLLREAGVPWIGAISADYPGSLLDVRYRPSESSGLPDSSESSGVHEVHRALALARACGYQPPRDDRPRVRLSPPGEVARSVLAGPTYLVVHPGASVPARRWPAGHFAELCRLLGREARVVVTGGAAERELCATVADAVATDLSGQLGVNDLAHVLRGARAVIAGNTGPAHLAAAVGTPVVSLFAPVVPAVRWAPYGVPVELLGDQLAACRDTRARECPVPGHPCLSGVAPAQVAAAVRRLTAAREVA